MNRVGIVGQGFVESAVREGMRHAFAVYTHDKEKGQAVWYDKSEAHNPNCPDGGVVWMAQEVDGPISFVSQHP